MCLLEPSVLATSKILPGLAPKCDDAHSWRLYIAAPQEDQAGHTDTQFPIQSYYPDTEQTIATPILIMQSARLWCQDFQLRS